MTAGVQCLYVGQTAVLKALPGICHPTPELEEGVFQFQFPKTSWQMALLPFRTAAGCTSQRPGRIP